MNYRVRSTPYAAVRRELASRGFYPGLPPRFREAFDRDSEMLREVEAECEVCRLVTMRLEAWTDGGEYLALQACRVCGHAAEF